MYDELSQENVTYFLNTFNELASSIITNEQLFKFDVEKYEYTKATNNEIINICIDDSDLYLDDGNGNYINLNYFIFTHAHRYIGMRYTKETKNLYDYICKLSVDSIIGNAYVHDNEGIITSLMELKTYKCLFDIEVDRSNIKEVFSRVLVADKVINTFMTLSNNIDKFLNGNKFKHIKVVQNTISFLSIEYGLLLSDIKSLAKEYDELTEILNKYVKEGK